MGIHEIAAAAFRVSTRAMRLMVPGGFSLLPMGVFWEPTMVCNQRCGVCFHYGDGVEEPPLQRSLPWEGLEVVLKRLQTAYRSCPWRPVIVLTGGEPLLHKDFARLIRAIDAQGFRLAVLTNLMDASDDDLTALVSTKPAEIRVSLDGPREIHDRARGVRGAFARTLSSLSRLAVDLRGERTRITLNCVLSRETTGHLLSVLQVAKSHGVWLNVQHLQFLDQATTATHESASRNVFGQTLASRSHVDCFARADALAFKAAAIKLIAAARRAGVPLGFIPPVPIAEIERYYLDLEGYAYAGSCAAPWGVARIDPLGNVYPCYEHVWGNLLKDEFSAVWNGEPARRFRRKIRANGLLPGCRRCPKLCRWRQS